MGIADLVTLDELRAAQKRVAGVAVRTPLLPARWAGDVWLKPESLQPIGAFKIRGAYTKIAALTDDERRRGVIAPSSGNHAQAVAYAARAFGIRAVLVMPESAAGVKVAATRASVPTSSSFRSVSGDPHGRAGRGARLCRGAAVRRSACHRRPGHRRSGDRRGPAGRRHGGRAGQRRRPHLGRGRGRQQLQPQARIVGAEPELAGDATQSFREGRRVSWSPDDTARTVADGLRIPQLGALPWRHIQEYVDDVVTVTEEEILDALRDVVLRSASSPSPAASCPWLPSCPARHVPWDRPSPSSAAATSIQPCWRASLRLEGP